MLAELGMVSVPTALAFPHVGDVFEEGGAAVPDQAEATARRVDRFCTELTWYAEALATKRAGGTPY